MSVEVGVEHIPSPSFPKRSHSQIQLCPLQHQEITRTVASIWKTPEKQSSLGKETKGGSQPHGHAAVGGWGMGTCHMKPHVRQAAPECGASPGGRAIKTNVFLLPGERPEEGEKCKKILLSGCKRLGITTVIPSWHGWHKQRPGNIK